MFTDVSFVTVQEAPIVRQEEGIKGREQQLAERIRKDVAALSARAAFEGKPLFLAVDAENIYRSLPEGKRVDYGALLAFARELGGSVRSALYMPRQEGGEKEKPFLVRLKFLGFMHIVHKPWRTLGGNVRKSDLDIQLALDVWEAAVEKKIGGVVLVTGDSDFIPLVEGLAARDIPTLVIGPDGSTSWELIVAATEFRSLSSMPGLLS